MSLPEHFRSQISPDTRYLELPEPVTLESGTVLPKVTVAYRTWGKGRKCKGSCNFDLSCANRFSRCGYLVARNYW